MKKLIYILFVLLSSSSHAQLMTNDNATITINPGVQLTVKGDIQNQNGTTINNSGTIDMTGNWIHNSANNCFGTSQGTVILNGAAQTIGGTNTTMFNTLSLQGTGAKTLLINTTCGGGNSSPTGVLQLNDLLLYLNSKTLVINNPSPSGITRTSGFIVSETSPLAGYGIIRWNMGTISAGNNFVFPFGNDTTLSFLPVGMNITTTGIASLGFVSIATYPTLTSAVPNNRPLPAGLPNLLNQFTNFENAPNVLDRWWIMDVQNYSFLPVSTLSFTYRDSEWDFSNGSTNTITEALLQAQYSNFSSWSSPPAGSVNTVSNTLTVNGVSDYNSAWALVGSNAPLPVELLYFSATAIDNKVVECKWSTASETNNDYFIVERSKDGYVFEEAGRVDGAGNSSHTLYYTFTDGQPYSGVSYYRLKQVDFDGLYTYSDIAAVNIFGSNGGLFVYPNPFTTQTGIRFSVTNGGKVSLKIYDAIGKEIETLFDSETEPGEIYTIRYEAGELAEGLYFCILIGDGINETRKIQLIK